MPVFDDTWLVTNTPGMEPNLLTSLDKVAKVNLYLADFGMIGAANEIYAQYFKHRPAKTGAGVNKLWGVSRRPSLCIGRSQMYRKNAFFVGILAAGCFVAASVVAPSVGNAQADPRITKSMGSLKGMAPTLGAPKLEGKEAVGGKEAPTLYFGTTKINNNFDIIDAVGKEDARV